MYDVGWEIFSPKTSITTFCPSFLPALYGNILGSNVALQKHVQDRRGLGYQKH